MSYCTKCGKELEENASYCRNCGASINKGNREYNPGNNNYSRPQWNCEKGNPDDVRDNMAMAVLSYISFLVFIPLFAARYSPFARFHCNQGLVLFICEVIINAVIGVFSFIPFIGWIFGALVSLLNIPLIIYIVLGIVNAANGDMKELPIIGKIKIL